ncbi:MAG: TSUP family transporter [Pseudomonadota bacterium]
MSLLMLLGLFATGLVAGFVDAIAGGGGLIALPVLLSIGLPPQVALGTNKFQSSFGSFTASIQYIRSGQVRLGDTLTGIVWTAAGAMSGALIVQMISAGFIRHLIPILLLAVFVYALVVRDFGGTDARPRMSSRVFYALFGLMLGFYDGFFGPGTGSFWTAAFVLLLGFNMTKAAGHTRVMNFTSNFVALVMFVLGGQVVYTIGLCMALGQAIGARLGARMAIRRGAGFIRPVFLTMVFLTILRLIYVNYGPLLWH